MLIIRLYYIQGQKPLSKPSTGEELLFTSPLAEAYHKWGKGDSIEIDHNCQKNAKYNIRQKANTVTNTKYQTTNKCKTDLDDPLLECHLKFTEKELTVQTTKEQMIIEGIKPSNTGPVCKCIYWRETGKSK